MTHCCRYVLLLLRARRVNEVQTLIAATTDAFASVMGPEHAFTVQCVFVGALVSFYCGGVVEMGAEGLTAAWQACCDQVRGSHDVAYLQKEYDAALAFRS